MAPLHCRLGTRVRICLKKKKEKGKERKKGTGKRKRVKRDKRVTREKGSEVKRSVFKPSSDCFSVFP